MRHYRKLLDMLLPVALHTFINLGNIPNSLRYFFVWRNTRVKRKYLVVTSNVETQYERQYETSGDKVLY